jgi:hypothetical protein
MLASNAPFAAFSFLSAIFQGLWSSCCSLSLKKSPRTTIPMFYNERCNNSMELEKSECNRFADSWRLVNFINHFRFSQLFYIGWLQLETKYMRVSSREQMHRAKYMMVEIKSPRAYTG